MIDKEEIEIIKILTNTLLFTMDQISNMVTESNIVTRNRIAVDTGQEIVKAIKRAKEIVS